jgi:FkbM family methyltransferase
MWTTLKRLLRSCLIKLDSRFPNLLPAIELELQKPQGKGWLASSTGFEVETAFRFLPASTRLNLVCLDVGANVGEYTTAILEFIPKARIHLFEPHPHSIQSLSESFSANSNVVIHELALGAHASTQSLFFNEPGSALSSLFQRKNLPDGLELDKSVSVDVSTIDIECKKLKLTPGFIKIDTEGNELEVLKGAIETILEFEPVIQFEFGGTAIDSRTFFIDYWNFFSEIDYSLFRITPYGSKRINSYSERDECFSHMNFIATKLSSSH